MSTLQQLLNELDSASSEKTASVKETNAVETPQTTEDIDKLLSDAGIVSQEDKAVEKIASNQTEEGGNSMSSLYDAVVAQLQPEETTEVEKIAAVETKVEEETTELEKIASSEDVQQVVDTIGSMAGDKFNEIFAEEIEKVASAAGLAPDKLHEDKGSATGMFGESGDARVETNRPADSEKHVDTTPKHYSLDEGDNSIVGMAMKKQLLSRQMHGRS